MTVHNLLFCSHTLCMSYVTNTFLLVSSSVRSKQLLCFVHRQGLKREQKHTTKNFVEFHNHSPLFYIDGIFWVYLGVRTCELFLCFVAIVRVRVYYMLTSLFSLFYVTGEFHRLFSET